MLNLRKSFNQRTKLNKMFVETKSILYHHDLNDRLLSIPQIIQTLLLIGTCR